MAREWATSRTPPSTIAPISPWRLPVWAEMPPILETLATPWITRTSPCCARLCASNSAMRLTCARAPSIGLMRWRILRTVSAGPTMVRPGMVGLSTDAPMTPHGMPSSSMVSEMIPVASPSATRRSTAPCGGRGTAISLMFSAAMRPVSRLVSATFRSTPGAAASAAAHSTSISVGEKGAALDRSLDACPGVRCSVPLPFLRTIKGQSHDRSLCTHQPERAENLHHARRMRAALQRALRRRLERRAAQTGIRQDQSQQQDSRDRRQRGTGRQALYRHRVRCDPDVPRREDREVSAQGYGQEVRSPAVADDPAHRGGADVRAVDALQAVRADGQRLFHGAIYVGDKAPL